MDPFTISINTVRGDAMHAVIQYALWVHRNLKAGYGDDVQWFEVMPEVRKVLESHLNTDSEPSLAIHSIYGHYFPWLVLLDKQWAASHVQDIFPTSDEKINSGALHGKHMWYISNPIAMQLLC